MRDVLIAGCVGAMLTGLLSVYALSTMKKTSAQAQSLSSVTRILVE